jgi:hypothetical protein
MLLAEIRQRAPLHPPQVGNNQQQQQWPICVERNALQRILRWYVSHSAAIKHRGSGQHVELHRAAASSAERQQLCPFEDGPIHIQNVGFARFTAT